MTSDTLARTRPGRLPPGSGRDREGGPLMTEPGSRLARDFLDRVQAPHGQGIHAVIVTGGENGHGPFAILACCDDQETTARLLRRAVRNLGGAGPAGNGKER